ncbi:hypothetical protein KNP414_06575 [Paenibacillus mucilaginosus KNP414]|uniref:Uncharacterized protein n=1 Tax=Paenibacillus mucilaginosus (strain KNP414) TaxID=1036673 RepID=F8F771_PAEMK|nr:hypothetical protein KNP414_06575 [Paenibacillus mucilaginosus KNP414]
MRWVVLCIIKHESSCHVPSQMKNKGTRIPYLNISRHFPANNGTQVSYISTDASQ